MATVGQQLLRVREPYMVAAIAVVALLARLLFSFMVFPRLAGPLGLGADPDLYGALARNWVDGVGYVFYEGAQPIVYRGPGYPLLLAAVYLVTGDLFPWAPVVQSALGALTCVVIFYIGKRAFPELSYPPTGVSTVGYLAALLAALHPLLVWYSPRLAYEPLFTFLLVLSVAAWLRLLRPDANHPRSMLRDAAVAGAAFGLAALVNQVALLLPLVLGCFWAAVPVLAFAVRSLRDRPAGRARASVSMTAVSTDRTASAWQDVRSQALAAAQAMVVVLLAMVAMILPWTIRNYSLTGRLIPVHTGAITQFVKGNIEFERYQEAPLQMVVLEHMANAEMARLLGMEVERVDEAGGADSSAAEPAVAGHGAVVLDETAPGVEEALTPYAVAYLRDHPERLLAKGLAQAPRFWYLSESPLKSRALALAQLALLLPAAAGVWYAWRTRNSRAMALLLAVLSFNFLYALTHSQARYSTPILPFVAVLAAAGIVTVVRWISMRLPSRTALTGAGLRKPFRVCMVVYHFYYRDSRIRRYAEALARAGAQVDVLCLRDRTQQSQIPAASGSQSGIRVVALPLWRVGTSGAGAAGGLYFLAFTLALVIFGGRLLAMHLARRYDVIHVHNMPDLLVLSALLPRFLGARVILDIHDPMPEFYLSKRGQDKGQPDRDLMVGMLRVQERLSTGIAHRVITANEVFRSNLMKRGLPLEKVTVVHNWPDPVVFARWNGFAPRNGFADRKPQPTVGDLIVGPQADPSSSQLSGSYTLIYPGTIAPRYGLDVAIEAMPHLVSQIPGVRLLIMGGGPEPYRRYLKDLAGRLGVGSLVEVKPPVPVNEVPAYLEQADVGIYPALPDAHMSIATPTKVLEYAVMGLPVVASRLPVLETLFPPDGILLFEPGNAASFARCVLRLYQDPGLARDVVRRVDAGLVAQHGWEQELESYFALLNQLCPWTASFLATNRHAAGAVS